MTTLTKARVRAALLFAALCSTNCAQVTQTGDGAAPSDAATGDASPISDAVTTNDVEIPSEDGAVPGTDVTSSDAGPDVVTPPSDGGLASSRTCNASALRPLMSGSLRRETSVGDRVTACGTEFGTFRYYKVVVPPGQRASLTATGIDGYRPRIVPMDRCNAESCGDIAWPTTGDDPRPAQWVHDNTTAAAQEYILAIGDVFGGSWNLAIEIGPRPAPPANTTCERALMLTSGVAVTDQDLRLGGRATPACTSLGGAPVLYYRVTVPSRGDVSVVANTHGSWPLTVSVLTECGAAACERTEVRTFTHHNGGLRSQSFLLAVSASRPEDAGSFDLTATVSGEVTGRYAESTTTGACDDVSTAGRPVEGLTGTFDQASPTAALPEGFAFELFGQSVTHYSMHSNGLLQLFADATGAPRVTSFGGDLGDPSAPNGLVAPLWMNLAPSDRGGTTRYALFGTAPNRRLVFDWDGWEFWEPESSAVHMQAKLFETTGVVEFHYCTLVSTDDRATGSHATVGLEALAGTAAAVHRRSDALRTSTALRFTPQ